MTVTVFGYLILINVDFTILFLRLLPSFSFDWEDISNSQDMFDHISEHLEVRQKYPAARLIFNSLLSVWKCGHTHTFVFDTSHKVPETEQVLCCVVSLFCSCVCHEGI